MKVFYQFKSQVLKNFEINDEDSITEGNKLKLQKL